MAGVADRLEGGSMVHLVLCEQVERGHQKARRRVRVANPEVDVLAVAEHVFDRVVGAVLVGDQQAVVAEGSVRVHQLRKDLAVGAVNRFHGGLVPVPRHLNLVEAHSLDHPGVVGRVKTAHLQAGLLLHVAEEGLPSLTLGRCGVGGNDAEVDLLGGNRHGAQADGKGHHPSNEFHMGVLSVCSVGYKEGTQAVQAGACWRCTWLGCFMGSSSSRAPFP